MTALKNYVPTKTTMRFYTTALFIMTKNLKKSGRASVDECISKLGYLHGMVTICCPKLCLLDIKLYELITFKKQTQKNHWKPSDVTLLWENCTFIREFSMFKGVFLSVSGIQGCLNFWKLINEGGLNVNMHDNHTLVYCAFPDNFP